MLDAGNLDLPHGQMPGESPMDVPRDLARLSLAFEDVAAGIRRGAEAGGLTLSEVRLLDGIARGTDGARLLSRQLRLDEGHVSRIVKRLRQAGLITARRQRDDSRRVMLGLSKEGSARLREAIDSAAAAAARSLEENRPISGEAVAAVLRQLLADGIAVDRIALSSLFPGDAGWVVSAHGHHYALEAGFDESFEAAVARIVADHLAHRDDTREAAWIARDGSERVGCIFCVDAGTKNGDAARLRLFLVRREWRGLGLGQRLLDTCRKFAAEAGYRRIVLSTHREHQAACRLYEANGFALEDSRPVEAYGQSLTELVWSLPLDPPLANGSAQG